MPKFCEKHPDCDMFICQRCHRDLCSKDYPPTWVTEDRTGNVCPQCLDVQMSLYDHAKHESGLTGLALIQYINRHYGHN